MVLVSIITVCYNSENTIEKTIQSVLSQTYTNYEHLIIDGGSNDNTISIIESYKGEYGDRLKIFIGKDKGIYDAMNKGIQRASGEIIGIINSDDWYDSTALENVVRVYEESKSKMAVITGDLVRTTIDGDPLFTQKHRISDLSVKSFMRGMPLQHPAVFVAKKVYDIMGAFDISYRYLADYDFIWRCFDSKKIEFQFTGTVTSYMREGGASDTFKFKNIKDRTSERYRLRSKYVGSVKAAVSSAKFFIVEITKQSVKRIIPKKLKNIYYNMRHGDK